MAKLTIVPPEPPEPQYNLELTLDEAAVIYTLVRHTAGAAKETTRLYLALGEARAVITQANQKFTFTRGDGQLQHHRIDPITKD